VQSGQFGQFGKHQSDQNNHGEVRRPLGETELSQHTTDERKDAQANELLVKSGQMALSHAIERSGNDPAEVFAALGADKAALADLGLTVSSILTAQPQGATMGGAGSQEPPSQDSEDEA
jgi:capsid protein